MNRPFKFGNVVLGDQKKNCWQPLKFDNWQHLVRNDQYRQIKITLLYSSFKAGNIKCDQ